MRWRGTLVPPYFCDCRVRASAAAAPADPQSRLPGIATSRRIPIRRIFTPGPAGHFGARSASGAQSALCQRPVPGLKIARRASASWWSSSKSDVRASPSRVTKSSGRRSQDGHAIEKRGTLSKPLVHDDVIRILELYRVRGYYNCRIGENDRPPEMSRSNLSSRSRKAKSRSPADRVRGNVSYSDTKLKAVVKTGITNLLSFALDNDSYDADRVENVVNCCANSIARTANEDVHVAASASYDAGKGGIGVVFKIDRRRAIPDRHGQYPNRA